MKLLVRLPLGIPAPLAIDLPLAEPVFGDPGGGGDLRVRGPRIPPLDQLLAGLAQRRFQLVEFAVRHGSVPLQDLDPHARDADPCLRHFDTLFGQDAALLRKEIEKAKFLDPADVFYVAFHFAEQIGRPREFGIDLLKLVVKRSPKGEVGKSAKNKLKSVGG